MKGKEFKLDCQAHFSNKQVKQPPPEVGGPKTLEKAKSCTIGLLLEKELTYSPLDSNSLTYRLQILPTDMLLPLVNVKTLK